MTPTPTPSASRPNPLDVAVRKSFATPEHPASTPAHPTRMPPPTNKTINDPAVQTGASAPGFETALMLLTGGFPLLSIRDLAEMLAVSENTVRKWVACGPDAGLVPKMLRINGQIRFRVSDVETFLIAREVA